MGYSRILRHRNLLFAATSDLTRRPLRSLVVTFCLTAILFPLVTALTISGGLRYQAEIALKESADFYVSQDLYGGEVPISIALRKDISSMDGVSRVAVRAVGRSYFVDRLVTVLGLDAEALHALRPLIQGEIPKNRGEVILGEGIVKTFDIKPGPGMRFTVATNNRKVFTPTGILTPSCLWSSDIMIMHYEDANEFFRIRDQATQLLIYGPHQSVESIEKFFKEQGHWSTPIRSHLKVEARGHLMERLRSGYGHRGGIFIILYVIGAALAIPVFLVTSGFGFRELHKEIGVLKALGWRIWEILEKVALENLLISLTAASLSILLSMLWLKGLNGIFVAQFYIAEVGLIPHVDIPSRYLPSHGLFCLLIGIAVTMTGGLFSAWKKASLPPSDLMR